MKSQTNEQLQQEIESLKAENEMLNEINKALQSEIESFKTKPASAGSTSLISKEVFNRDGIVYGFVYPGINHKGELITADHVLKSEALQDELIKMKSGFIKSLS
jgi:hypothetical protein